MKTIWKVQLVQNAPNHLLIKTGRGEHNLLLLLLYWLPFCFLAEFSYLSLQPFMAWESHTLENHLSLYEHLQQTPVL